MTSIRTRRRLRDRASRVGSKQTSNRREQQRRKCSSSSGLHRHGCRGKGLGISSCLRKQEMMEKVKVDVKSRYEHKEENEIKQNQMSYVEKRQFGFISSLIFPKMHLDGKKKLQLDTTRLVKKREKTKDSIINYKLQESLTVVVYSLFLQCCRSLALELSSFLSPFIQFSY